MLTYTYLLMYLLYVYKHVCGWDNICMMYKGMTQVTYYIIPSKQNIYTIYITEIVNNFTVRRAYILFMIIPLYGLGKVYIS